MEVADVMRMEADVAVQLAKAEPAGCEGVRLGRMHIYPFASRPYIDLYGLPKDDLDELSTIALSIRRPRRSKTNVIQRACSICRASKASSRFAQTPARAPVRGRAWNGHWRIADLHHRRSEPI